MPKKSTAQAALAAVSAPIDQTTVTLDGRVFAIAPFGSRRSKAGYKDSVAFLAGIAPIIKRVATVFGGVEGDLGLGSATSAEQVSEMLFAVAEMDLEGLIEELGDRLPSLVAMVCRGTEPDFSEDDVYAMGLTIVDPDLVKAVWAQIKVENLLGKLGSAFATKG